MTDAVYTIEHDVLWPIDEEHRYRVYSRVGPDLEVLCACPEAGGVGEALVQFHIDQKSIGRRLADLGRVGVLDVIDREWIVLPWDREAAPRTVWL